MNLYDNDALRWKHYTGSDDSTTPSTIGRHCSMPEQTARRLALSLGT